MHTRLAKTITIVAIVSLLSTGSALAQMHKGHRDWAKGPPTAEEKLARISDALDLDSKQSAAMLVVLQQQEESMAAVHERIKQQMGPEMCAQKAASEKAILEILTDTQTERYLQMREDRKESRSGRHMLDLDCPE